MYKFQIIQSGNSHEQTKIWRVALSPFCLVFRGLRAKQMLVHVRISTIYKYVSNRLNRIVNLCLFRLSTLEVSYSHVEVRLSCSDRFNHFSGWNSCKQLWDS